MFSSILDVDRSLWEQKVAKESEFFVATFGRRLSSITLFVHARYGARKVLCTGLMECGGVLVQNSKVQVTPTRGQKIEHAAPLPHAQLGKLHTTQSAQLVTPHQIWTDMDNEIESIDNQSEEVDVAAAAAAASITMGLIGRSSTPLYRERLSPSSLPLLWRDKPMLELHGLHRSLTERRISKHV